jgi:hypothetical protein
VACMEEERELCKVLVGKPEENTPLGRPRCRWEDGIRMDPRESGRAGEGAGGLRARVCVEWIHLTQDSDQWQALLNAVMNLQVLVPQS